MGLSTLDIHSTQASSDYKSTTMAAEDKISSTATVGAPPTKDFRTQSTKYHARRGSANDYIQQAGTHLTKEYV